MIKNVIEHLEKVDTYGVISIALFFPFFVGMLIWAFRLKKGYLSSMETLPLEDGVINQPSADKPTDSRHE